MIASIFTFSYNNSTKATRAYDNYSFLTSLPNMSWYPCNTSSRYSVCQLPGKLGNYTFSTQKLDLGLETQETNVGIRINILEIPCVPIFRQNGQFLFFLSKFAQNGIRVGNSEN